MVQQASAAGRLCGQLPLNAAKPLMLALESVPVPVWPIVPWPNGVISTECCLVQHAISQQALKVLEKEQDAQGAPPAGHQGSHSASATHHAGRRGWHQGAMHSQQQLQSRPLQHTSLPPLYITQEEKGGIKVTLIHNNKFQLLQRASCLSDSGSDADLSSA